MAIVLKPEQQRVIDLAIGSGAYRDAGELALEDWMLDERAAVAAHIEKGFAEAGRGELIDGSVAIQILRERRLKRLQP
jgi:hypothetical protein